MIRTSSTSRRYVLPLLAASALFFALVAPATAEVGDRPDCGPALAFLEAQDLESVLFGPIQTARKGGSIDDPGALAFCTANCWDGNDVSCSGTWCSATDSNCSQGVRGQCYGTYTGTKSCATCEAICTADCQDGSTVTCTGSTCNAYDWSCTSAERGHCNGSSSGTKYCPVPDCPCSDSTYCDVKNGSPCSGGKSPSDDCTFRDGGCGSCFCDGSEWVCTI